MSISVGRVRISGTVRPVRLREACEESDNGDPTTCEDDGQGGTQGSLPQDSLDESLGQDGTTSTTDESDRSSVRDKAVNNFNKSHLEQPSPSTRKCAKRP